MNILDLTLKHYAQLDAKDAAALLTPISPGQPTVDLNAALQLLKPKSANTFPDLSFNDPALIILNSILANPLNPFAQSLLSNTNAASNSVSSTEASPAKRPCVETSLATSSVQPISPSHTASTSSCGSAISPQECPSPWPSSTSAAQSPKKTRRKPPAPIPEEKKDDAYYERRKKNNDAAKRSRDARRMKEEQTASRAATLEHENLKLRGEIASLKSEITKLRLLILTNFSGGVAELQPTPAAQSEPPSSAAD